MNADPITEENLKDANWDRAKWFAKHGPESWQPVLDKAVAGLKEQGVARFGGLGYCFGAPPALYLTWKGDMHVNVLAHPSRVVVPDDLEVRINANPRNADDKFLHE